MFAMFESLFETTTVVASLLAMTFFLGIVVTANVLG